MANYCCAIRTNYFHVKDADEFRKNMSRVYGCEDTVDLWEDADADGNLVFGFGCYNGISGLRNTDADDDDDSYDAFIDMLQKSVADDDAVIIFESGNEKLRYIVGSAEIITSKDFKRICIDDEATQMAAKMIQNPGWRTVCSY